jgi:hypothetical protein
MGYPMKTVTSVLFAGLILARPAHAQLPSDDVQCLVVSTVVNVEAKSEQIRNSAALTTAFYLGRIDGRIKPENLAALVKAQKNVPGSLAISIFKACAARADDANTRMKNAVRKFIGAR